MPISSTWTEEGISLGSGQTAFLKAPRVLLAWDTPASSLSAGWARYTLEQRFGQRVTAMRAATLQNFDMKDYDVLVLPSGNYNFSDDALPQIEGLDQERRNAHHAGGGDTLGVARSRRPALDRYALSRRHASEGRTEGGAGVLGVPGVPGVRGAVRGGQKPDPSKPFDFEKAIQPEREQPENLPGAMLRVNLYPYHWLTAGLDGDIQVIAEGTRVFAPLKLDAGVNVGVYAPVDKLVASGHVWKEALPLLSQRAYLMHQPTGRGHVIGFAEDPNYRAYAEATQLLFINAVLLSGGHDT